MLRSLARNLAFGDVQRKRRRKLPSGSKANSQKRDKVAHGSKLKVNFFVVMFVISFVLCIFAENKELCYDTVDIKH